MNLLGNSFCEFSHTKEVSVSCVNLKNVGFLPTNSTFKCNVSLISTMLIISLKVVISFLMVNPIPVKLGFQVSIVLLPSVSFKRTQFSIKKSGFEGLSKVVLQVISIVKQQSKKNTFHKN